MSSIRPHNIRDTDCESPFLKFFEGRDRLEGHQRIADNSMMPSFRWCSKILGREHVGSSPTSLSSDSMVIIKLSCYVFKFVKQYNLLFGLFFGYVGTLDFFVCSCYVKNYCNMKTYKKSYEG